MVDGVLCTGDDEEIDQASSTKERSILIYKKYAECQIKEQNLYKVKSRSLHQTLVLLKSWQISLPLHPLETNLPFPRAANRRRCTLGVLQPLFLKGVPVVVRGSIEF